MKRLFILIQFIAVALLALECCAAAFAQVGEQENKTDLSGGTRTSPSGLTGAGAGGSSTTAAKPGGADGLGNPILGGERHPLYRLRPSDVVEISFTVAPEFNQTLTVQPDGYVMLKDAGMVEVQGLNAWSLLAAKFVVPFAMFHLAALVFTEESRFRQFEVFALIILAYLSFTAIAFLVDAESLIFPRYILDEGLGFHVDRARGPLLQAVANGVSLNMLGLLALHTYRRGRIRGVRVWLLLASVPIAILATMTRTVWLSFAGTVIALIFLSKSRTLRFACMALTLLAGMVLAMVLSSGELNGAISDRLEERGPVDYRAAVYAGGWEMFLQRPLTGWGFHQMPAELPRYVSGYNEKMLYPHNTYFELLAELGVPGLALYLWLMWELWKLGRCAMPKDERNSFLDAEFHRLWPILLAIYWVNAAMVVMSYQFVNGLLFTMAGMLAAQRRRSEGLS